jgi:DNA-binding NarL/FixJ family response regulator
MPDSPAAARPVPELPLQGLTLLVVEDSRFACEALRLMALRSGARMRRAATLRDARAHLRVYRPDAVLVDMGLPDGSGAGLIRELALAGPGSPVVLGLSGDPAARPAALAAGAAGFVEKPLPGLAMFQRAILRHLPGRDLPDGQGDAQLDEPDRLALAEDLAHAARLLAAGPDARQRAYLSRFLGGIARSTKDQALARAAVMLADDDAVGLAYLGGLVALRLDEAPGAFGRAAPA